MTTHALTAVSVLDPKSLLRTFGVIGVGIVLFAETGLLIGLFLPGDSLLFLAGIAASAVADDIVGARLNLAWLMVVAPVCAIAGAQFGRYLGARFGPRLFARPESRLFKSEYVDRAEDYFNRYGPAKAVVLARFVPIVRTFLNPVAGILHMPGRRFLHWNVLGGLLWTEGVLLAGYFSARTLRDSVGAANIDKYLLPAVAVVVLISMLPLLVHYLRHRADRRRGTGPESPQRHDDETAEQAR
jgi:membrane-associated protein